MGFNQIIKLKIMKKNQIKLEGFEGLNSLTPEQLLNIDGGGFWYDISYVTAVTMKVIFTFAKDAVEYQHSLPANLKK